MMQERADGDVPTIGRAIRALVDVIEDPFSGMRRTRGEGERMTVGGPGKSRGQHDGAKHGDRPCS